MYEAVWLWTHTCRHIWRQRICWLSCITIPGPLKFLRSPLKPDSAKLIIWECVCLLCKCGCVVDLPIYVCCVCTCDVCICGVSAHMCCVCTCGVCGVWVCCMHMWHVEVYMHIMGVCGIYEHVMCVWYLWYVCAHVVCVYMWHGSVWCWWQSRGRWLRMKFWWSERFLWELLGQSSD